MSGGGRVPGELLARSLGACASRCERLRISEQVLESGRHRVDVPRWNDRAGTEPAHHLAEPADVVDDRGETGTRVPAAARPRRRSRLGRERARPSTRTAHGAAPSRAGIRAAIPPGHPRCAARPSSGTRGSPTTRSRAPSTPRTASTASSVPLYGRMRPRQSAVRPSSARCDLGTEDGMADHAQLRLRNAEVDELPVSALGVHDDALEPSEQGAPHRRLGERAPRDHVVRRENGRAARMEQPPIQPRGRRATARG